MKCFAICVVVYIILEIVVGFIFSAIAQIFYKKIVGIDFRSLLKGTLERLFLAIALINNYPTALILFGALKLGTRLKHRETDDSNENKFNDYYLIGNLISVMIVIFYVYLYGTLPKYIDIHF